MRRFPCALVLASLLLTQLAPRPAAADAISDKQAEAQRIVDQLQAQGDRLSQLAEQYDQARLKADQVDQQATSARAQLAQSDNDLRAAVARVKAQAVDAYVRGGSLATASLANANGSSDPSRRDQYLSAVIGAQQDAIDGLRVARQLVADRQTALSRARQAANQALARVNADQAAAASVQQAEQATLRSVKGELAGLVAAAAKRQADADAAKARAAMAARGGSTPSPAPAPRTVGGSPGHTTTTRPGGGVATPPGPPPPPAQGASAAVAKAKQQLGKPYQYGGAGPDTYDCSGLTMVAWQAGGVSLPHSAEAQYSVTTRVAIADLQPGDLVFYGSPIHHVGIYTGGGQMIEAPQTGEVVQYASIYRSDLVGAGRP